MRRNLIVVLVLGDLALAGCGGLGSSTPNPNCPNGTCSVTCSEGMFASGGTCVAFGTCPAGTYVGQEGTATSDRVCEPCPSGRYSTSVNAPSCMPWSTCPIGSFVASPPSASADRTCLVCPAGLSTTGENQQTCGSGNPSDCRPGTVQTASSGASTCVACSVGEFCAGGGAAKVACTGDTWDNDGDPATACVAKTTCLPGSRVLRQGSATADRTCEPCPAGYFASAENAPVCAPWTSCAVGSYVANTPSASADRVCLACAAGTSTSSPNESICLAGGCRPGTAPASGGTCAPCTAGEYCAGGTAPSRPCAAGTWDHDHNPATACVARTDCQPGTYVANIPTATENRSCTACESESWSAAANSTACAPWRICQPGTYVAVLPSSTADRLCAACATGTNTTTQNQLHCLAEELCPVGSTDPSCRPSLTITPDSGDLGSVVVGETGKATVFTVTNSGGFASGALSVAITGSPEFVVSGDTCTGVSLAAGSSCTVSLALKPATAGAKSATLVVTGTSGNPGVKALTGLALSPARLVVTPDAFAFKAVRVNQQSTAETMTVKNEGGTSTGVLVFTKSGSFSEFPITANTCSPALAPNGTCTFKVAFAPTSRGDKTAAYTITDRTTSDTVTVTGTGLAPTGISIVPSSVGACIVAYAATVATPACFPETLVGSTSSTVTFTATADNPLPAGVTDTGAIVIAVSGSNAADFPIMVNGCTTPLLGGTSCSFGVAFAASAVGSRQATVTVTTANGGLASATLQGNGLSPTE